MSTTPELAWIAVDWGTSNLRCAAVGSDGSIIATKQSDRGMSALQAHEFEPALLQLISDWLTPHTTTPVFVCGMAGARQGWCEAGYRSVPCKPLSREGLTPVPVKDSRLSVKIIPGLSQQHPPDIMRGEETQLAGLVKDSPAFHGSVCLPGTHSKWVSLENGVIENFTTYMTGEMFALLCSHSILQHSVATHGHNDQAFQNAAMRVVNDPSCMPAALFTLRASSMLQESDPTAARSTLSGLLIGQELATAQNYWRNQPVTVIGDDAIANLYVSVLNTLGCKATPVSATDITVAGIATIAYNTGS